jgi:hypothetical protein
MQRFRLSSRAISKVSFLAGTGLLLCLGLKTSNWPALASDPTSHNVTVPTVAGETVEVTWAGTIQPGANAGSDCTLTLIKDPHTINLTVPPGTYDSLNITAIFRIEWADAAEDLIITVTDPDAVATSQDGGTPYEELPYSNPAEGTWTVDACAFLVDAETDYTGRLTLTAEGGGPPPAPPLPEIPTAPNQARFYDYTPGPGIGENAGEPTVGYNLATGHAMFLAGLTTLRVTFPERLPPEGSVPEACEAQWEDVSGDTTSISSLDPILFTDQNTGRTFVSQLFSRGAGPVLAGLNSLMAFTDDDGENWTPAQVNPPDSTNDHQSVGAGPYPADFDLTNPTNGGSAVYYCAQDGVAFVATSAAYCARSDDGGLNFGKAVQVYNGAPQAGAGGPEVGSCGPGNTQMIHGHVKVAPDGTVYLPNSTCGNTQIIAVSTDAATTWAIRPIPGSISPAGILDPSVGISLDPPGAAPATSNTIYVCYTGLVPGGNDTDNHIFGISSKDRGVTWTTPVDLGASLGIKNAVFAEAVAGDSDRAACGFLGTTQTGDHQAENFNGTWHAFVAYTYDGGTTWKTVNASPNGPVQREACIWNGGGANPCRNLLDFNEITMDEKGRVIFGFADGCINDCETGGANSFSSKGVIARQSGGKGLLAAFDPVEPAKPLRACLSGQRDDTASYLRWVKPDDGGSEITGYRIYRGTVAGSETLIGQIGKRTDYVDRSVDVAVPKYYYKVTAINAVNPSDFSNTIELTVGPRVEFNGPCTLPGVQAISDPAGDETNGQAAHDITSVSMAELADPPNPDPNTTGHASKLYFVIKVANLATVPPGFRWAVRFGVEGVTPPPDASGGASEDFFVSMVTSDSAAPSFTYGVTSVPQNAARVFTTIGNLDDESGIDDDGTITLVLPKSAIGNPAPGTGIVGMLGSVRATVPSVLPGTGGTNETIPDSTGGGSYTLRPDNLCLPNVAPVAVLEVDSDFGEKPLLVRFDGSDSSDGDVGIDTIAKYTFNFGDGAGDTTQDCNSNPDCARIAHTFTEDGVYIVKLVVSDSRGKLSSNVATRRILVGAPASVDPDVFGGAGVASLTNTRLGGAMALLVLIGLGGIGYARRRRRTH